MNWEQIKGILSIAAGIYLTLLASGVLPRKPKDPERMALWRRKFGPFVIVGGPCITIFGLLQLLGMFK
jgi:hypothetical protein